VRTYVVGITDQGNTCGLDPNPPNVPDLDAVAAAGGTTKAVVIDAQSDPVKTLTDALNGIRGSAQVPCQYTIPPPPPGETFNRDKVNVQYTPPGGQPGIVYAVDAEAACDPAAGGWFYSDNDTIIKLCGATCNQVTSQAGGILDVALGCDRQSRPK
jgi:hypothetical protein